MIMITNTLPIFLALAFLFEFCQALPRKDILTILSSHNQYRAKHRAPDLKWNYSVASFAQRWTNRCVFEHSDNPSYGENIAMGYDTWDQAVDAWYSEVKMYNYNNPGFSGSTGHFTQVVWKETTEIGCGFTDCNGRKIYSCNYQMPGNYQDRFRQNVLPSK
ncbi:CAP domain-containing protein [Chlamydoabsidia padenii]|nr:CAP domain-containing protein [Chlamydoabsidia padenii]